jgi:hypothetical protein
MQITSNTTGMLADLAVAADRDARDHCVVAIKGTFRTNERGELSLADEQRSLVAADEHYGDPATTSVRYECDFALEKTLTDVIVMGKAVAPRRKHVTKLAVRLEVNGKAKDLVVYGERRWVTALGSVVASDPLPFDEMPITFDRAWGGYDDSRGVDRIEVEERNLVGVGFHPHRARAQLAGLPVPNVEALGKAISSPRDRVEPAGLGCIGRAWQPRVTLAGTYDERWREERAPYLPADFDSRYFQCAPRDQQFPLFAGGEILRCVHMAEQEVVAYRIPTFSVPVRFRFGDGEVERQAALDTVTLEPHLGLAMLVFRASVPLRKKLTLLLEVQVGARPAAESQERPLRRRGGKPVFGGLDATLRWLRQQRARSR